MTTTTSSALGDFAKAKYLWQEGTMADAAQVGLFWTGAAPYLDEAVAVDPAGTPGYTTASQELRQIAALPDAMLTPAQQNEERADVAALNIFFGTPGLYS